VRTLDVRGAPDRERHVDKRFRSRASHASLADVDDTGNRRRGLYHGFLRTWRNRVEQIVDALFAEAHADPDDDPRDDERRDAIRLRQPRDAEPFAQEHAAEASHDDSGRVDVG
jgi:hypothetical protein